MDYTWIKFTVCISLGFGFWIIPTLVPMPKISQGLSLVCALTAAATATRIARPLITHESHQRAKEGMGIQLLQRHLTMQTLAEERALDAHFHTEVNRMAGDELERIQERETTVSTSLTSTSPQLVCAVRKLAEVRTKSDIVENVLGFKGRRFNEGMAIVEEILATQ